MLVEKMPIMSGSTCSRNDNVSGPSITADKLHTGSYYAASANSKSLNRGLDDHIEVDVCVVGGGYSGLSTALKLAEAKFEVCVVEAKAIGWGASGRNGGQIVNGLNAGLEKIGKNFGTDISKFVAAMVCEGGDIIRERIKRYSIECDYRPGNIFAAHTDKHLHSLQSMRKLWRGHGLDNHEILDANQMRKHVASDAYCGGMIDTRGGHMHPLNLALGEAAAIESLGGKIFEHSEVLSIAKDGERHVVKTAMGSVKCRILVLCGNAYLSSVAPEIEKRVMPVSTQVVTTEPLGAELAQSLLPSNMCVEDVRYILDYYRLTADHRLLFGGGTVYGGADPNDIRAKLLPNILKVFPQLEGLELEYAWSGNFALSYSRIPQMGRLKSGAYFAQGYSGHGVTGSHLFGVILAQAIMGDATRYDVFSGLPCFPFPGGRAFRVPYSMIGSWWYGLRDKMGI